MSKKHTVIYIYFTIFVFVLLVIGATYAYLSASLATSNSIQATTSYSPRPVFSSASGSNITLNATAADLKTQVTSATVAKSATAQIKVKFTGGDSTGSRCTYDLVLNRTGGTAYVPSDAYTNGNYTNEFTVAASVSSTWLGSGSAISRSEININKLSWSSNKATLVTGASIQSKVITEIVQTWNVVFKIYNLPADQTSGTNKITSLNWVGNVSIANVNCMLPYA